MFRINRWIVSTVLSLCLLTLAGCGDSGTEPGGESGEGAKKYYVVFSQCNNAEPYRAAQNQLMEKLWGQYDDVTLEIMDAGQDNSKQRNQIETTIRKKPNLLIVAPNERGPLTKIMGEAMAAGIPTLCLERDILEPNYPSYIQCDNLEIGRMAGKFILEKLKEKHGGEITIMCVGTEDATKEIRTAIAMGCDDGVLMKDPEGALDPTGVARALAEEMANCGRYILITATKKNDNQ